MNYLIVSDALGVVFQVLTPPLIVLLAATMLMGIIRSATQIDDPFLNLAGKFVAFALFLSVATNWLFSDVVAFASRIWGGKDFFF